MSRYHTRSAVPVAFRAHLLSGDHWRVGQRLRHGAPAEYAGMRLAQPGQPKQLADAFVEHLDQALVEQRIDGALHAAQVRYARIEACITEVARDRPDEIEALRWALKPFGRRPTVAAVSGLLGISGETLRRRQDTAVILVWDEIGGVW